MGTITHAQIEPTTRCNFTCGFCAGRSMRQGDLAWDGFTAFLEAHPNLRHVELQGEGEPLLHPRFFDMAAACTERGIAVGLITNGSLLGEAMVERLLDARLAAIHVSLETSDPARFQAIRGGRYTKVAEGIARLARRRRERGLAGPVIGLAVTVLADTIEDIAGILDLYHANGLDGGISHQLLQTMPAYRDRYSPSMLARLVPPARQSEMVAIRAELARQAPLTPDYFYASLFRGFDPRLHDCPWLERGAYLGAGGSVAPCCFIKDEQAEPAATGRAALSLTLERGEMPAACSGCSTAAAIVQYAAAQAGERQTVAARAPG
jgi:MoaA/NifB/PqqE/SkfB family radical SAM enzyme